MFLLDLQTVKSDQLRARSWAKTYCLCIWVKNIKIKNKGVQIYK